jgi:hypothetical protein
LMLAGFDGLEDAVKHEGSLRGEHACRLHGEDDEM